ncbi:MAG TPA: glycoside hydrolase family 3 N-terminal domain-containing protein [Bacteroidia bacterium]|nr:glycoside hydrolase family 3 N-terminal domain-containing protein [Bacteroidia bacterium]
MHVLQVYFCMHAMLFSPSKNIFLLCQLTWLYCLVSAVPVSAQKTGKLPPFYTEEASHWADSVLATLTPGERISQLIMVAAWSNKDTVHTNEIRKLITNHGIGGLIFFQGGPVRQAVLTNEYQSLSKVPLMIGIDGEWGLSMRLDSTVRFPRQMTLSADPSDSLIYTMGAEIARECRRLGIHINFAPDADINDNPLNPIIGSRSFGDDREEVSRRALLYMKGMQDNRVLANGKHFPGHGNAESDSHLTLPLITQTRQELDSVELYPFRKLIHEGLGSMMVAHLSVPALDTTPNLPSTLSKPIVSDLLKSEMGFKGLVFTDALNMKGVSSCYQPGILDKKAILAGNDILLYTEDVRKAIDEILISIKNGEISQQEIDARAKKLLMAKYWCGLNRKQFIDTAGLVRDLNTPNAVYLQRRLYEQSVTLLTNRDSIIPLKALDSLRIASVVIGDVKNNAFQQQLKMYGRIDCYAEEKDAPVSIFDALFKFLKNYDLIILSMHGTSMKAQANFAIPEAAQQFIDKVITDYPTVFVNFGNAYTFSRFQKLDMAKAVILAYEDFPMTHELAAQAVMGGISTSGKLPVNSTPLFTRNTGRKTPPPIRLKYTVPEDAGVSTYGLNKIDTLVGKAIAAGATPGCQVLVAKDGKVIYNKSFGSRTYTDTSKIRNTDLYDIASVTKIAATALGTMKLFEDGKINLNQPLSKYLPALKTTNKRSITVKEVMAHQAGLQSWIPFWKQTVSGKSLNKTIYQKSKSANFPIKVADSLYMNKSYTDSLMTWIYKSPLGEKGKYVYSDLGPILLRNLIERISKDSMPVYLEKNFYKPLQLSNSGFLPKDRFSLDRIVPTENDKEFRQQLIQGYVHDPAAAMLGGISGNAGLFSNANDLAVILQMLLNKGSYGGKQLLKPNTVTLFTKQQFVQNKNRRGLLFDKPDPDPTKSSPCSPSASLETFGHQGFTGTCVWVDPKYNLIYIFLSNRIHPDATNDKLVKMNLRTDIQQAIYDSFLKK